MTPLLFILFFLSQPVDYLFCLSMLLLTTRRQVVNLLFTWRCAVFLWSQYFYSDVVVMGHLISVKHEEQLLMCLTSSWKYCFKTERKGGVPAQIPIKHCYPLPLMASVLEATTCYFHGEDQGQSRSGKMYLYTSSFLSLSKEKHKYKSKSDYEGVVGGARGARHLFIVWPDHKRTE